MLNIKPLAKSELNSEGEREVFFEVNGQLRTVYVRDKSATEVRVSTESILLHMKQWHVINSQPKNQLSNSKSDIGIMFWKYPILFDLSAILDHVTDQN